MQDLIEQVVQWGRDRGLDKVGHLAQAKYTLKETAELLDAYADGDQDAMNDAIGDILVTLIVGASNTPSVLESFTTHLNQSFFSTPRSIYGDIMVSYVLMVESERALMIDINLKCHNNYILISNRLLEMICIVNHFFNQSLSLKDCLQLAYDEIKNRKGKLVNGQFIKECNK